MGRLKEIAKRIPGLLPVYSYFTYHRWQPPSGDFNKLLDKYFDTENIFFIQVGANDGVHDDPIKEHIKRKNWKGIFVEPQKRAFELLKTNYANKHGLVFEKAAITNYNGKINLYRPSGKEQSPLASLSNTHLQKFGYDSVEKEEVDCMTFDELLKRNSVTKIDLLVIDTEGHDYQVLSQVNFKKIKPGVIIYEYLHIPIKDYKASLNLLKKENYRVYKKERDIIAIGNP